MAAASFMWITGAAVRCAGTPLATKPVAKEMAAIMLRGELEPKSVVSEMACDGL